MSPETAEVVPGHSGTLPDRSGTLPEGVLTSPHPVREPARRTRNASTLPRLLAMSDAMAIVAGLAATVAIMAAFGREVIPARVGITALLLLPVWYVIAYVAGLYNLAELKIHQSVVDEAGKVVIAVTAWSWLLIIARMALSADPASMFGPILLWLLSILFLLVARSVALRLAQRKTGATDRVAIVGTPSESGLIMDRIERHPEWGISVEAEFEFQQDDGFSLESLADRIAALDIDRVMLAGGSNGLASRTQLVSLLVERDLTIDLVSGGAESLYSNSVLHDLEGLPVMSVRSTRMKPADLRLKRIFDLTVASFSLLVFSPVLVWAAIRIKLDSPGPVFFRQVRCGYDGQPFEVLKFRTMEKDADEMRDRLRVVSEEERDGDVLFKLADDPRVTRFGATLRKWSIDELPQLWNVIKGEMSIVGPRPLPFDEADKATGLFSARTSVRPGLAGPWQAYGRSRIPFEDMIRLDYAYAVGWSMAEDIRLLFRTAGAVFNRRGAY